MWKTLPVTLGRKMRVRIDVALFYLRFSLLLLLVDMFGRLDRRFGRKNLSEWGPNSCKFEEDVEFGIHRIRRCPLELQSRWAVRL